MSECDKRLSLERHQEQPLSRLSPELSDVFDFFIALTVCNTVVVTSPDQPRQKASAFLEPTTPLTCGTLSVFWLFLRGRGSAPPVAAKGTARSRALEAGKPAGGLAVPSSGCSAGLGAGLGAKQERTVIP